MLYNTDYMVLLGHVINDNHYISTTRVSMATKFDNLPWWTLIDIVTWPFDHVVLVDPVTN